ncbi:hypothetical protein SEVIR_6G250952v4 [Setaria viridis]
MSRISVRWIAGVLVPGPSPSTSATTACATLWSWLSSPSRVDCSAKDWASTSMLRLTVAYRTAQETKLAATVTTRRRLRRGLPPTAIALAAERRSSHPTPDWCSQG